ncbi:efflux RND transporter permease subunit [Deinococcus rubellus]|uniref:Efflux RND transporter permease subunit n=1 Tax=Deinococcus rubellus TaxID=1889240 RepID=A0ABY5YKZ3_9DEIO|nr:efflux RND transporter permease subunit [Deinococcus rubellus]UWX64929.1 efflux RND transporter permease subunit [Deinococcus rubellus]
MKKPPSSPDPVNAAPSSTRQRQREFFGRINPIVNFSVSRYVFSIGIFVGIVVFGFVSLRSLGVDLLPTINIPVVNVSTNYAGASPVAVDKQVTQVIESAVAQVIGATSVSSTSSTGSSRVTIQFADGTDQNASANQVASLVAGATRRLPSGVDPPSVRTFNPNAGAILEFGVSGGKDSLDNVYDYTNNVLLPALQLVDGVANVTLSGGSTRQIQVLLNPDKLASYGLTPSQVSSAITSSSVNSSIGTITQNNTSLTYTTNSLLTSVADVAGVKVDAARGIQVSDVADVRNSATTDSYTRVNGLPVVLVSIQQTAGSNAVSVVDNAKALLTGTKLPTGYKITFSNDTTTPIRTAIASTQHELYLTALVVAIVTMLFLGRLNTAFTVIAAIPISLAAAPILYKLMGFTFNQVSLLALIVAIGIVVDDSIVVAENVERYRALGYDRVQAVLKGASEVFSAVTAASLSLLAVLIPVSFLGGIIGSYLQQFALGLAAAVFLSWLEALLFLTVRMAYTPDAEPLNWRDAGRSFLKLPGAFTWGLRSVRTYWFWGLVIVALAAIWTTTHKPLYLAGVILLPIVLGLAAYLWGVVLAVLEALTTTLSGWTNGLLGVIRNAYVRTLDEALHFSPLVLLFSLAFLAATLVVAVPKLNFTFTPATDSGTLNANLRLPSDLSLATANQLLGRMETYFLSQKDVQTVQSSASSNGASVNITLKPIEQRPSVNVLTAEYQRGLQSLYTDQPDVRARIFSRGGFRGQGSQQTLTLVSSNLDTLTNRAALAVSTLEADPNVLSVSSSADNTSLENRFVPNQNLLTGTGLTASSVASTLSDYASGDNAGSIEVSGITYPIKVEINPARLTDEQSLLSLPVYSSALKSNLSVGQLGSVVQGVAPNQIQRDNRIYSLALSYQPAPDSALSTNQLTAKLQDDLTKAGILDNLVSVGAADRNGGAALGNQLGSLGLQAFGLSLLLVYLVMGSQFNSFRYPFYLLLPVPFAVAGALWLIFLSGSSLDIFGVLGFLLLIGLSAKNAIIYLEFVVEQMQELPLRDALIEASRLRFRPIVMTTITVMVVSLPLLLNNGSGSEYGKSISLVVLGGVSVSAIMTFFVVPAAFYLFERKRAEKDWARRAQLSRETRPAEARPPRTDGGYAPGS